MDDKKQEEEEEEESEAISHQTFVKEWEQIQSSPPPPISHIQWEILLDNPRSDFSVFPPSNHEGLHISHPQHHQQQQQQQQQQLHVLDSNAVDANGEDAIKEDEDLDVPQRVTSSPCEVGSRRALDLLFNSGFLALRDALMRKLRLGFGVLRAKLFWVASLVRFRIGANWGVVASALWWSSLWHLWWWWWRRRRRLKREKRDSFILLLQGQNEKISQLSEQITRLNEILLSRRRIPILDSS